MFYCSDDFFTTDTTEFKEQEAASNVVSFFKKTAAETHRMLQEAFGDNAMT
jgi:hypothetical protein